MRNQLVKIMLVDDSRTMRRVQKNVLAALGFSNVIEAEDGSDALNKLEENTDIDLILLDWNMPNMSGIEVLKKLKTMPATKDIPVLMVTSEAQREKVVEAVKAGVADYLVKPFEQELLGKKIKSVLGIK